MASEPQAPVRPAISAEHLVRRFGSFTAVNDVSFCVEKGEIFGFLGPNGSGKTTVIKMLTGLLPLSGGSAQVEGLDVRTDSEAVRERIGYMSQNFSLYYDLTVEENLKFYGRMYSLEPARLKRRMDEIIELNGLTPYLNRLASQLSRGWKLRLARRIPGIRSATIFGQSIHALVDEHLSLDGVRAQLAENGIAVNEIRPLTPSLEDVFVELTYKHESLLEAASG